MNFTKGKFVIIASSLILVGFLLGGVAGLYMGIRINKSMNSIQILFAASHYGSYAHKQYQNAPYEEAKKELLLFIQFLDKLSAQTKSDEEKKIFNTDAGLTYARLAILEEKSGNGDGMKKYFRLSQERLKLVGWSDYSKNKIREMLKKLDKN